MSDAGLVLGLGTVLAPMIRVAGAERLSPDPERVLALLSVTADRPVAASVLAGIERAAEHWRRGDKALANLRLVFAGLPRCAAFAVAARMQAADWLLDHGMTPRALMRELGLDTAALDAVAGDLAKYNPDQPRVPAGSGAESGRWTDANFGLDRPNDPTHISRLRLNLTQVAANGPIQPDGYQITFTTDNALDPKGLNTPPTPEEQNAVATTLNAIISGNMLAIGALEPHPYENRPHGKTGAVLPPAAGKYVAFDIPLGARGRENGCLIIDSGDLKMFFTTTHYRSFYNYNIRVK